MSANIERIEGGQPRTKCCNASIRVERVVSDTLSYTAIDFNDDVLGVVFHKTYDGDSNGYVVSCLGCGELFVVDVVEKT